MSGLPQEIQKFIGEIEYHEKHGDRRLLITGARKLIEEYIKLKKENKEFREQRLELEFQYLRNNA